MEIPERVVQRLIDRSLEVEGGCIETTYCIGSHGYGVVGWWDSGARVVQTTHRAMWLGVKGPVPDGYHLHHKCFNKKCLNLDHLEPMEAGENIARTNGHDWELGFCKWGHPRSETYVHPSGKRECHPCKRGWGRRYQARRRQELRAEKQRRKEESDSQRIEVPDPEH